MPTIAASDHIGSGGGVGGGGWSAGKGPVGAPSYPQACTPLLSTHPSPYKPLSPTRWFLPVATYLAGLQTLYSGKAADGVHLNPAAQWLSWLQKHSPRKAQPAVGAGGVFVSARDRRGERNTLLGSCCARKAERAAKPPVEEVGE